MAETRTYAWPTLERVRQLSSSFMDDDELVDDLVLDCSGCVDIDDPFDQNGIRVMPTMESVAALSALVDLLGDRKADFSRRLDELKRLRDAASLHVLHFGSES